MTTDTQEVGLYPEEYAEWEKSIVELAQKHGELTPQLVLWEASRESSPLHALFTWDDTEAANAYREQQARGLIRKVKVKLINYQEETETPLRAFVNVKTQDADDVTRSRYIHVEKVLRDDDLRQQMLENAKRELAAFKNKYAILAELSRVFTAIDESV